MKRILICLFASLFFFACSSGGTSEDTNSHKEADSSSSERNDEAMSSSGPAISSPSSSSVIASSSSISSSSIIGSSSSVIGSSSSAINSSSSAIIDPSACTAANNTATHYCSEGAMKPYGSVTHGGKTYKTVMIGSQIWMAENLNYATANGSVCYDNLESNCDKYGRLYNWVAAMGTSTCPEGFSLPNNEQWNRLTRYLDGESNRDPINPTSAEAGVKLKTIDGWLWNDYNDRDGNGTDDVGFSALPGGSARPMPNPSLGNEFFSIGGRGYWWSATEENGAAYQGSILNNVGSIGFSRGDETFFASIRCIARIAALQD